MYHQAIMRACWSKRHMIFATSMVTFFRFLPRDFYREAQCQANPSKNGSKPTERRESQQRKMKNDNRGGGAGRKNQA